MNIGHWIALAGVALSFLAMLAAVVRWALRMEIKQTITTHVEVLTEKTLAPLQAKLDALSSAAGLLAQQMQAAQAAHKEERGELHEGLKQLREFLEKLDRRVDGHGERLAVIEAVHAERPRAAKIAAPRKRS